MELTQEMIDSVFADPKLLKKFSHPRKDKHICERRLAGELWHDIAKRCRMSEYYCRQVLRKVDRLYKVFILE